MGSRDVSRLENATETLLTAAELEDIGARMPVLLVPSDDHLLLLFCTKAAQQGLVVEIHWAQKSFGKEADVISRPCLLHLLFDSTV